MRIKILITVVIFTILNTTTKINHAQNQNIPVGKKVIDLGTDESKLPFGIYKIEEKEIEQPGEEPGTCVLLIKIGENRRWRLKILDPEKCQTIWKKDSNWIWKLSRKAMNIPENEENFFFFIVNPQGVEHNPIL